MIALLALEDGRVFRGESFGAKGTSTGEICFNTSMSGYQEILTDPSYRGQIVAMTYPEIGNYGEGVSRPRHNARVRDYKVIIYPQGARPITWYTRAESKRAAEKYARNRWPGAAVEVE